MVKKTALCAAGVIALTVLCFSACSSGGSDKKSGNGGDVEPPEFVSAVVNDISPCDVEVQFSEEVSIEGEEGFVIYTDSGKSFGILDISDISGSHTDVITFILSAPVLKNAFVYIKYNSDYGSVMDIDENPLASFGPEPVENNVLGDLDPPVFVSARVDPLLPNAVEITFNEPLDNQSPDGFTVNIGGIGASIIDYRYPDNPEDADAILLETDWIFVSGQTVTVDYDESGGVTDLAGNALASFAGAEVDLSAILPDTTPPAFYYAVVENGAPSQVVAYFNEAVQLTSPAGFTISAGNITGVSEDPLNRALVFDLDVSVPAGEPLTIDYDKTGGDVTDLSDNELDTFPSARNVMNMVHYSSEGTTVAPVDLGDLTLAPPDSVNHSGQVGPWEPDNTHSYYKIKVRSTYCHTVQLTNLTRNANLYIYSDDTFSTELAHSSKSGTSTDAVDITANGDYLYIRVDSQEVLTPGTAYNLIVEDLDITSFSSEGSIGSPQVVTVDVSHNGVVNDSEDSYYYATITDNHCYQVSLTDLTQDADLYIYSNSDFENDEIGHSVNGGTDPEMVEFYANGTTTIYLRVSSLDVEAPGTYYNLLVTDLGAIITSEGTQNTPHIIAAEDTGQVGPFNYMSNSYYEITGLTEEAYYTVTMSNLTKDADLYVYSDNFTTLLGSSANTGDNASEHTLVQVPAGTNALNIRVDNYHAEIPGTSYTISIVNGSSEGSIASPVHIGTVPDPVPPDPAVPLTYDGQVDSNNSSYYTVTVTPDEWYTITLTGTSADVSLQLYSGSGFEDDEPSTLLFQDSTLPLTIMHPASDSSGGISTFYIRVQPFDAGTTYTLSLTAFDSN